MGVALVAGGGRPAGDIALEAGLQRRPLVVGHHREVDVDPGHAGQRADGPGHPVGDLRPQRAAGDGEGDGDGHPPAGADGDVAHHVEVDDAAVELRILHRAEDLEHFFA